MEKIDLDKIYSASGLKWLKANTIYQTLHGSHAYGTNIATSDIDLRGICIPPKKYPLGILDNFEQTVMAEPIDCTIFGIQKFCKLAADGNPNALEIIFTDPSDVQFINKIGESLLEIRDSFVSKKCKHTLKGYAFQQLKRIKTHRQWIVRGDIKKPERSDFDLPDTHKLIPEHQQLEIEAQIKKVIEEWTPDTTGMEPSAQIKFKEDFENILTQLKLNHEDFDKYAARSLGLNDNLTEAFQKERAYKSALRDYKNWEVWKLERNKARFELEEKFHYDTKHGSHLVRLYLMCIEVLQTHKINVKRPDAEFLLSIRNGAWSYDQLIEWAENQNKIIDDLYKISTLKNEPERLKINEWLINVQLNFYQMNNGLKND